MYIELLKGIITDMLDGLLMVQIYMKLSKIVEMALTANQKLPSNQVCLVVTFVTFNQGLHLV